MKIIQILISPDNHRWRGNLVGLGDDGKVYVATTDSNGIRKWTLYIDSLKY